MITRYDRALDSDSLYDFTYDNDLNAQPSKGSGKRRASTAGSGRMVSLGPLWKYRDKEDIQYQGQDFGVGPTLQNSAPSKRSKSAKPPARILDDMRVHEEVMAVTEELVQHNIPPSQLATLPVTRKGPRKKLLSRLVKEVKIGPFKNPVITKPTAAEPKIKQKEDRPTKPVSNHPGWTTTQEAVKLSKTTLDKLAVFRYGFPSKATPEVTSPKLPADVKVARLTETNQPQAQGVLQETSHSREGYGGVPQDYAITEQIPMHVSGVSIDGAHSTRIQPEEQGPQHIQPIAEIYGEESHMQSDAFFDAAAWKNPHEQRHTADTPASNHRYHEPEDGTNNFSSPHFNSYQCLESTNRTDAEARIPHNSISATSTSETARQISNYGELTSSEMQLMEKALAAGNDDARMTVQASHAYPDSPLVGVEDLSHTKFNVAQDNLQPHSVPHTCTELPQVTGLEPLVSKEIDSDDFSDDIDDTDLLEFCLAADILVVGPRSAEDHRSNDQKQSELLDNELIVNPHCCEVNRMTRRTSPGHHDAEKTQGQSHLIPSSDLDDEYPLDHGDEEYMLNFPDLEAGAIESYEAFASLNHGIQEDLGPRNGYQISLQFSSPKSRPLASSLKTDQGLPNDNNSFNLALLPDENMNEINTSRSVPRSHTRIPAPSPLKSHHNRPPSSKNVNQSLSKTTSPKNLPVEPTQAKYHAYILDDTQEYELLAPFARPDFPATMRDRSPIIGLSAQTFLRVCFRVGEMFKEGGRCEALNHNAVIELFARVTFSSREVGTTKQHFQFADLWHDRPPYPTGLLANYKSSGLTETESRVFIGASGVGVMARCLGTLKREKKSGSGWLLHICSIRQADWEEIRWTRRIVSAGQVKSEH